MTDARAELLAAVERSPQAAGAHDRDVWVGLFAPGATIEDPVGSRPHAGRAQIERFYDTFIGPRAITFHRRVDVVAGRTVIRDLTLEVRMGASVRMSIPAFLRYDFDGDLKIVRLQAFWELPAMVWQFVRSGGGAVPAGLQLSRALLRNQGLTGTAGFLAGLGGIGRDRTRPIADLLDDACAGDEVAVKRRLTDTAVLARGVSDRMGSSDLTAHLAGARWDGMLRAGDHVVARAVRGGRHTVLICALEPRRARIAEVGVFAEDGWT